MQVQGVGVSEALDELRRRLGWESDGVASARSTGRVSSPARVRQTAPAPRVVPELEEYVGECVETLWGPRGTPFRRWLAETRRLPVDVLRAARVGADLGTARQPRPDGLPRVGQAVVLPVLLDERACFAQLRVLGGGPGFPKYLSPRESLAPNPRLGMFDPSESAEPDGNRREVIVTEGIIDALSAAAGGYRAAAVLGAGYPDPRTAAALERIDGHLVVAFDPDPAGRAGADRFVQLLRARGRRPSVMPLSHGDLNDSLVRSSDWPAELASRVRHARHLRDPQPPSRPAPAPLER